MVLHPRPVVQLDRQLPLRGPGRRRRWTCRSRHRLTPAARGSWCPPPPRRQPCSVRRRCSPNRWPRVRRRRTHLPPRLPHRPPRSIATRAAAAAAAEEVAAACRGHSQRRGTRARRTGTATTSACIAITATGATTAIEATAAIPASTAPAMATAAAAGAAVVAGNAAQGARPRPPAARHQQGGGHGSLCIARGKPRARRRGRRRKPGSPTTPRRPAVGLASEEAASVATVGAAQVVPLAPAVPAPRCESANWHMGLPNSSSIYVVSCCVGRHGTFFIRSSQFCARAAQTQLAAHKQSKDSC